MIFFIADTHFSDKKIIDYENRPYKTIDEMDKDLIFRWNMVVENDDEVYVLGDFGADGDELEILSKLKGTIYLVKGNHDTGTNTYYRRAGFAEVYDHPIIIDNYWILSHEPIYVNAHMPYVNIFGHIHNSSIYKDYGPQHYCVSVERTAYRPVSFSAIAQKIQ